MHPSRGLAKTGIAHGLVQLRLRHDTKDQYSLGWLSKPISRTLNISGKEQDN